MTPKVTHKHYSHWTQCAQWKGIKKKVLKLHRTTKSPSHNIDFGVGHINIQREADKPLYWSWNEVVDLIFRTKKENINHLLFTDFKFQLRSSWSVSSSLIRVMEYMWLSLTLWSLDGKDPCIPSTATKSSPASSSVCLVDSTRPYYMTRARTQEGPLALLTSISGATHVPLPTARISSQMFQVVVPVGSQVPLKGS